MKNITFFDHNLDLKVRNTIQSVAQKIDILISPVKQGKDTVFVEGINIENAEVIIAHIDNEPYDTLISQSKRGDTRLRVSSVGIHDKKFYKSDKGVNCLFLRKPYDELSEDEWKNVLSAITNSTTVNEIIGGRVPKALGPLLGFGAKAENILALSILCQGYLFAWACNEKLSDELLNGIKDPCKNALQAMGFDSVNDNTEFADAIDKAIKCFNDQSGGTRLATWWQVFEADEVCAIIKEEMESCWIKNENFRQVLTLAEKIDTDNKIEDGNLVATAYLQIKDHEKSLIS